jgi:hypothetical protein
MTLRPECRAPCRTPTTAAASGWSSVKACGGLASVNGTGAALVFKSDPIDEDDLGEPFYQDPPKL